MRVLISVLQTKFVACNIGASIGVLILLLKFLFRRQSLAASNTHWPWTAFGLPGCQRVTWTCGQRLTGYVWITGVTRRWLKPAPAVEICWGRSYIPRILLNCVFNSSSWLELNVLFSFNSWDIVISWRFGTFWVDSWTVSMAQFSRTSCVS